MTREEIEGHLNSEAEIIEMIKAHIGDWAVEQYKEDVITLESMTMAYNLVGVNERELKASYILRLFEYKEFRDDRKKALKQTVTKFRN